MKYAGIVLTVLISGIAAANTTSPWLMRGQFGAVTLVVSKAASQSEQTAAQELQKYWASVTGQTLAISDTPSDKGANIWVGTCGLPASFVDPKTIEALGGQGILLKAIDAKNMLIVGGPDNGALYAAYEFIEGQLGVRFFAPDYTYIPAAPASIAWLDYSFVPPFEYRYSTYFGRDANVNYYRQVMRYNPGPSFACHTVYRLLPPEKYFKEHPEYYSMIDGKRVAPVGFDWHDMHLTPEQFQQVGQLCMSNPGTIAALTKEVLARIEKDPSNKMVHISQMDWGNWCTCDTCKAIDEREGSHMGATLFGLNQIAENVEKAHPGYGIETLAYTFTRKPPKHMKPRDNVAIKLCSIECDFSKPLADPKSKENRAFAKDIQKWSKLANRLHIWDYTTNYRNFQTPFPNLHVLKPNVQFFRDHNVKGLFEQGSYDRGAEFAPLRSYLLAKLQWNPDADADAIVNEFAQRYYGEAAPYILEYIQLITNTAKQKNVVLGFANDGSWIDSQMVAKAEAIFAKAFQAVDASPRAAELRPRVEVVYLQVQYSALTCAPDVTITDTSLSFRRPPCLPLEDYVANLKKHGVVNIIDYFPFDDFYKQIGGVTPPREFNSTIEKIGNARYELWVAPKVQGSILRWRDKKLGVDLLNGYKTYGRGPGTWQDWTVGGQPEKAAADTYEIVNKTPNALTLRATLPSGVVVERTMTLKPDSNTLDVSLTCANPTDAAQPAGVKLHPEFSTLGADVVEVWTSDGKAWTRFNGDVGEEIPAWGRILPAAPQQAVFYLPKKKLGILATFGSGANGGFVSFYNTAQTAGHVNLELMMPSAPVQPGKNTTIHASYSVVRQRPDTK